MYYIARALAGLLLTSGAAMVMPLFDPLRYRGLIYYNGVVFPFIASVMFFMNIIQRLKIRSIEKPLQEATGSMVKTDQSYFDEIMIIMVAVFSLIFIFTLISLILTKKQAKEGME